MNIDVWRLNIDSINQQSYGGLSSSLSFLKYKGH